jgi:hypothetical protein
VLVVMMASLGYLLDTLQVGWGLLLLLLGMLLLLFVGEGTWQRANN